MARHHRLRRWLAAASGLVAVLVAFFAAAWALAGPAGAPGRPPAASAPARTASLVSRTKASGMSIMAQAAAAQLAAIDHTLARTAFVRVAGRRRREVALTFDDGPGPYTPSILSELERAHVPATFFAVGVLERYFHDSTTREARDGDVIGDHTFTHAPMADLAPAAQGTQLLDSARTLERYGAPFPHLFRPPYGMFNDATLALLRRYRMLMVLWTVDTNDYRRPGVRAIVHAAVAGARPGAIILLHDAGGNRAQTVSALPKIIAALRRRHYALVTVPRLLEDSPAPGHQNLAAMPTGAG